MSLRDAGDPGLTFPTLHRHFGIRRTPMSRRVRNGNCGGISSGTGFYSTNVRRKRTAANEFDAAGVFWDFLVGLVFLVFQFSCPGHGFGVSA